MAGKVDGYKEASLLIDDMLEKINQGTYVKFKK